MLARIGKFILDYLLGKVFDFLRGALAKIQRHKEINKQAEESVKPIEEAKTEKEIDDASRDVLGGL
jgi:hypothetical protein